jgi:hypothetical protein
MPPIMIGTSSRFPKRKRKSSTRFMRPYPSVRVFVRALRMFGRRQDSGDFTRMCGVALTLFQTLVRIFLRSNPDQGRRHGSQAILGP